MARTFHTLEGLSSWRRLAPHVWERPQDPTVYGVMELVVDRALPYLDALSRQSGTKVRLAHLVTKALALAIRSNPEANGIVSGRRLKVRSTVDIFVQVAVDGGRDLSGAKITRVDEKSLVEIAREVAERAARVRRHADPGVERTKGLVDRLPAPLLHWTVRLLEYLIFDRQLDLSRFGIARDQFGSAMVSNVGTFGTCGMTLAFAPLVPISRSPIVILIGEVQRRAVVESERIVPRSVVSLGCTFDHRMIDGAQATSMAAVVRRVVENPEQELGAIAGLAPAGGAGTAEAATGRAATA
jgi:pyruvate/2-oxoglutarate dehydrogenase complex dihydrolipoamide acyltransferase (E2) component